MKISELVKKLQKIQSTLGDVDVRSENTKCCTKPLKIEHFYFCSSAKKEYLILSPFDEDYAP